jgi:hypothetical protein
MSNVALNPLKVKESSETIYSVIVGPEVCSTPGRVCPVKDPNKILEVDGPSYTYRKS